MPRTIKQGHSRTAVLGILAAVAAEKRLGNRQAIADWLRKRGLRVGGHGLRDALQLRMRGGGVQSSEEPAESDWIRKTLDFDPTKLDLDLAVVVLPGSERTDSLLEVLRRTRRVIRIYRGYDRDLVVLVAYDGARERRWLQTLLEEHEPSLRWIVVREVDSSTAEETWLDLARQAAEAEGLLAD